MSALFLRDGEAFAHWVVLVDGRADGIVPLGETPRALPGSGCPAWGGRHVVRVSGVPVSDMSHLALSSRAAETAGVSGIDEQAMVRLAAGDQKALAELFDRHKTRVAGYLYRMVGDRGTAEDLLGETFLRVYRARSRFRPEAGFAAWLYRIAHNLAVAELRRRSSARRGWLRLVEQAAGAWLPWQQEPDGRCREVQEAVLSLPEEQRTAIVLREYLQMSYEEIGRVLGCRPDAARARAYRARMALRSLLLDAWGEEPDASGAHWEEGR